MLHAGYNSFPRSLEDGAVLRHDTGQDMVCTPRHGVSRTCASAGPLMSLREECTPDLLHYGGGDEVLLSLL